MQPWWKRTRSVAILSESFMNFSRRKSVFIQVLSFVEGTGRAAFGCRFAPTGICRPLQMMTGRSLAVWGARGCVALHGKNWRALRPFCEAATRIVLQESYKLWGNR